MHALFSLKSYFMINMAIMISYIIVRCILALPSIQHSISEKHKLKFIKLCFITTLFAFLFMPFIMQMLPIQHENSMLNPIFIHAKKVFLHQQKSFITHHASKHTASSPLTLNFILLMAWLLGFSFFFYNYMKAIFNLQKIKLDAYCRSHRRIHILFSDTIQSPFCWSFYQHHFIAIPNSLLEKHDDMQLAIRHELQHIRQGDTRWLSIMTMIQLFCFWNPFIMLWKKLLNEQQEFACDEALIVRKKTSKTAYAACLINTANSSLLNANVLAINGPSKSILYRRVNMLFSYRNHRKKLSLILAYLMSFLVILPAAYALNGTSSASSLTTKEIHHLIKKSNLNENFNIRVTPELIAEINKMRRNEKARAYMLASLNRMKQYQSMIEEALKNNAIPNDFLALPLVQSGYQPLDASKNRMRAAGVWQFIPSTADHFGLVVNTSRDDRLDTALETKAAAAYLKALHEKYHDWNLVLIAYEAGDEETDRIIKKTKSRDLSDLANASTYPELKKYVSLFSAALIVMHHPSLITNKA